MGDSRGCVGGDSQYRWTYPIGEDTGGGSNSDDDEFGRRVASQPQVSERIPKAGIVAGDPKSGTVGDKVVFAENGERPLKCIGMDRIHDDDQLSFVDIRCEVHARRAEVDNLDVRAALVLATEGLHGEGSESVVTEEYVAQPNDGDTWWRTEARRRRIHWGVDSEVLLAFA